MRFIFDFLHGIINGLGEIWAHKVRSMLSMVGIILGVASLVAMLTIVENLMSKFKIAFEDSGGVETFEISPQDPPTHQVEIAGLSKGLRLEDCDAIKDSVNLIRYISPFSFVTFDFMKYENENFGVATIAVTSDYLNINNYEVAYGRNFGDLDYQQHSLVAILGYDVALAKFENPENALGGVIKIRGIPFTVIGVAPKYEFLMGSSNSLRRKNRVVFIPATTHAKRFKGDTNIQKVFVKVEDATYITDAVMQIENTLRQTHNGIEDFQVATREEALAQFKKVESQYMFTMGSIAFISLMVGGIGIMNVMLAVINERIREIGVRKSVGARGIDIFIQFLAEAAVISFLGGVIGMAVSILLVNLLSGITEEAASMPVPFHAMIKGFSFSVIVGLVSGIYPAVRAARLDPIEALRCE